MEVKMVDLQRQYLNIKSEIDAAIQKVLLSTAFIHGEEVQMFSKALATFTNAKSVIPCANGTDALQIAMMALGLKPGDEVILPVHTYVATTEVVALLGLTPVFVDVDEKTFNIDVSLVTDKITSATRAIVPVHLYGQCANMEPLLDLARQHNLFVIEDAAQALGAVYTFNSGQKRQAGTMGIGTTSFFPSKNLGCYGDGGAIFTNDETLGDRIRMIANHGQKKKYHYDLVGVNSRLDTLQAAILNVKLKYLNGYTQKRNQVADYYDKALGEIDYLRIPVRSSNSTHVFHQYTLIVEGRDREQFKSFLEKNGIQVMIYYPVPIHLQTAYRRSNSPEGTFPVTERLSKTVISIPIYPEMPESEMSYICDVIKKF
jgi:UDP-2-acetamido-2-deoxy-ribo-hexuluronate aminotransferase